MAADHCLKARADPLDSATQRMWGLQCQPFVWRRNFQYLQPSSIQRVMYLLLYFLGCWNVTWSPGLWGEWTLNQPKFLWIEQALTHGLCDLCLVHTRLTLAPTGSSLSLLHEKQWFLFIPQSIAIGHSTTRTCLSFSTWAHFDFVLVKTSGRHCPCAVSHWLLLMDDLVVTSYKPSMSYFPSSLSHDFFPGSSVLPLPFLPQRKGERKKRKASPTPVLRELPLFPGSQSSQPHPHLWVPNTDNSQSLSQSRFPPELESQFQKGLSEYGTLKQNLLLTLNILLQSINLTMTLLPPSAHYLKIRWSFSFFPCFIFLF